MDNVDESFPTWFKRTKFSNMDMCHDGSNDWTVNVRNVTSDIWLVKMSKQDPYELNGENVVELYDGQTLVATIHGDDQGDEVIPFPEWYHASMANYMFLGGSGDLWFIDPPNQLDWRLTLEHEDGTDIWFVKGFKEDTFEELVRVFTLANGSWKLVYEIDNSNELCMVWMVMYVMCDVCDVFTCSIESVKTTF